MKRFTHAALIAGVAAFVIFAARQHPFDKGDLPDPVTDADFYNDGVATEAQVELGRLLYFDKILSGNQNISCATCHHPKFATTDGISLPLGEGPRGLGPDRRTGHSIDEAVHERVPRNTPAVFNLGAREFIRMFHDGRVETDPSGYYEGGFITPAKWKLPGGLDNVLAAQAMFPITSPAEMAGQKGENEVAEAKSMNKAAGPDGVWALLSSRVAAIPEYVERFKDAFPDQVIDADDINMVLAANAIAVFEAVAFRADNSPFDQFLRGESALPESAQRGLELFYGSANCSGCHSGKFQTDHEFYAIAMPQIGPGKNDGRDPDYWRATGLQAFVEDFGRGRVTVRPEDDYKFRTPSLRNVELTAPYGHAGTYLTLEDVVRHHVDPLAALEAYTVPQELLPPLDHIVETTADGPQFSDHTLEGQRREGFLERDSWVMKNDALRNRIAAANQLEPMALSDDEVSDLLAFLVALTDDASRDLTALVPESVPSGLPVTD